jgi:hypothetical protein
VPGSPIALERPAQAFQPRLEKTLEAAVPDLISFCGDPRDLRLAGVNVFCVDRDEFETLASGDLKAREGWGTALGDFDAGDASPL